MHIAAQCGHSVILSLLIEQNAKCEIKDKNYSTPLHYAVSFNRIECVDVLLYNCKDIKKIINQGDFENNTPLHIAAQNGHIVIASKLVQAGAKTEIQNKNLDIPLFLAIKNRRANLIPVLISKKEDFGICDKNGKRAFELANEIQNNEEMIDIMKKFSEKLQLRHEQKLNITEKETLNPNDKQKDLIAKESDVAIDVNLEKHNEKKPKMGKANDEDVNASHLFGILTGIVKNMDVQVQSQTELKSNINQIKHMQEIHSGRFDEQQMNFVIVNDNILQTRRQITEVK